MEHDISTLLSKVATAEKEYQATEREAAQIRKKIQSDKHLLAQLQKKLETSEMELIQVFKYIHWRVRIVPADSQEAPLLTFRERQLESMNVQTLQRVNEAKLQHLASMSKECQDVATQHQDSINKWKQLE